MRVLYIQGALQAGKVQVRKVKGTSNPGNFLTKHAKSGPDVLQALPSLGIVNVRDIAGASAVTCSTIKSISLNDPKQWQGLRPQKLKLHLSGNITLREILGIQ